MAEKRDLGRHRKRFSLRFGIGEATRLAFTEDISTTGLFIKTTNICNPGKAVVVELLLDEATTVTFEALVMWAKKVPPQMIHLVKKSGMGVRITRFISGEAEYLKLFEKLELR